MKAKYFFPMPNLRTLAPPNAKKPAMGLRGVVNGSTIGKNACGTQTFGANWSLMVFIGVLSCVQVSKSKWLPEIPPIVNGKAFTTSIHRTSI